MKAYLFANHSNEDRFAIVAQNAEQANEFVRQHMKEIWKECYLIIEQKNVA